MRNIARQSKPPSRTVGSCCIRPALTCRSRKPGRICLRNPQLTVLAHHLRDLPFGHTSAEQEPSPGHRRRLLIGCGDPMNYQAFTNDSLTMMYEGIRGALSADDALSGLGEEPRFRVRETPDWKKHAADLETEMLKRGMFFEVIDWSEDQATLPF
jgi:hypothetical protein